MNLLNDERAVTEYKVQFKLGQAMTEYIDAFVWETVKDGSLTWHRKREIGACKSLKEASDIAERMAKSWPDKANPLQATRIVSRVKIVTDWDPEEGSEKQFLEPIRRSELWPRLVEERKIREQTKLETVAAQINSANTTEEVLSILRDFKYAY